MRTTKEHFKTFCWECEKWIDIFGLRDWEIIFTHEKEVPDARASCYRDLTGRIATINLGTDWSNSPNAFNDEGMRKVAFHEACELLIAPLYINACARHVTEEEIKEASHTIIRILENVLWKNTE